jgi:hypothetical protein
MGFSLIFGNSVESRWNLSGITALCCAYCVCAGWLCHHRRSPRHEGLRDEDPSCRRRIDRSHHHTSQVRSSSRSLLYVLYCPCCDCLISQSSVSFLSRLFTAQRLIDRGEKVGKLADLNATMVRRIDHESKRHKSQTLGHHHEVHSRHVVGDGLLQIISLQITTLGEPTARSALGEPSEGPRRAPGWRGP